MKVVVGLGNPGREYVNTRHNVGFRVIEELSRRLPISGSRHRFESEIGETMSAGEKVLLVCPQTFMNASGRSVRQIFDFFRPEHSDLLVVCDDMNLDSGRLRLRPGGSAGGQKGLADIIRHMGTEQFARLRLGIGRPPGRMAGSDYVLSKFRENEREEIEHAVVHAADGVERWLEQGLEAAMNQVNAPPESAD